MLAPAVARDPPQGRSRREWVNRGKNMTPKRRASTLALIAALAVASCSSPVPPAASPSASQTVSAENAEDSNRVQRYGLTDDGGQLRLSEPETILEGIPAAGNHNGGRIAFGPDGKLHVGTGDAGQRELSQDLDSLAGKILRLNPDGSRPADNPFDGSFVYSYGHRNVQGLAWTADGTMYASEFGASTFDELNRIEPGGNYGWPEAEGDSGGAFLDPVAQWATSEASPSGIAIRGEDVFIANLRGRSIRRVNLTDPGKQQLYLAEENTRFRDVAVSPTGEIWVLTNNTDGRGDPGPDDDRLLRLDVDD
ncbi:PQQ-dependent sugar dehydrogenase [Bowdeniella nasicola]|nr:PQQ-dependent sugar dehydrogenase [Bowdeniella nasicola]